jgi:hypothetical protein
MKFRYFLRLTILMAAAGCSGNVPSWTATPDRESLIPSDHVKITPKTDIYPPQSLTDEYTTPVPLPYPVNTLGAEDSAFVMPDGNTLYVWFTPDANRPAVEQVLDGVTGIYVFRKVGDGWGPAERVTLQDPGKPSLDGCGFVLGNRIWFCSAREGHTGMPWYTAEFVDGAWQNVKLADFRPEYEVGELHITADGREMYFHSARPGGKGGYDIWLSTKVDGDWQEPVNLAILNSPDTDGWPFISPDGNELWFTRQVGHLELWRSKRGESGWGEPEKMFSPFAGEASMDIHGNIYFTHHFYKDNFMIEADIYTAHKTGLLANA